MILSPLPIQKFFGNNGRPLVGGQVFTYEAGTTTKIATYQDEGGTPNTNPIVLDFRGEARIWLDPRFSYKFVLSPPNDTDPPTDPIWTVDNISIGNTTALGNFAIDTGAVNAIVVSDAAQVASLTDGLRVSILVANTNTAATTINYNGLGVQSVVLQNGSPLVGGELQQNGVYEFVFANGDFQLMSPELQPTQQIQSYETTASLTPSNYWKLPRQALRFASNTQLVDAADLYAVFGNPRKQQTGFSYVTGNIFDCPGPGKADHDFDTEQNFLSLYTARTGANEYWVDCNNGNDANSGSLNAPFKTIRGCFQNASGLGVCWILPGTYTEKFDVRGSDNTISGGTLARAVRIKAWAGPGSVIFRDAGDQPGTMLWTLSAGSTFMYEATPSGSEDALHIIFHETDKEIQIQYYSSSAAVDAVSSGWYQDPGTKKIYIRYQNLNLSLSGNAARFEIMYGAAAGAIVYGATIYLEGITFRGGNQLDCVYDPNGGTPLRPIFFARDCLWQYRAYHNMSTQGAFCLLQDCVSEYSLGGDGYNYNNDASGQSSEIIEVDCIGRNNGVQEYSQFDGDRNKQGSSGHETAVITRVNGEYYGNYGQNIADTGSGSKTWMVGSICGAPYAELQPGGIGGYYNIWTEGTVYLDNVEAGTKAATYGLYIQSGTANLFNCNFYGTTSPIGKNTGVSALYDPVS